VGREGRIGEKWGKEIKEKGIQLMTSCREIKGTHNIVVATVSMLKEIINNTEWNTAKYETYSQLLHQLRQHVFILLRQQKMLISIYLFSNLISIKFFYESTLLILLIVGSIFQRFDGYYHTKRKVPD